MIEVLGAPSGAMTSRGASLGPVMGGLGEKFFKASWGRSTRTLSVIRFKPADISETTN
jgi:hypothetical protein